MITIKALKAKEHYRKNKARIYAAHRIYIHNHSEARKKYLREYWSNPVNQQKRRDWYKKNVGHIRKRDKEHYHKTRERHRELRIALAHGITVEEYRRLHEEAKGLCGICGKPEKEIHKRYGNPKVLAIDHNHKTGKVRGVLCANCNSAVGLIHEDINVLDKIRDYITKYA